MALVRMIEVIIFQTPRVWGGVDMLPGTRHGNVSDPTRVGRGSWPLPPGRLPSFRPHACGEGRLLHPIPAG